MDPIVMAAGTALVGAMATDAWQQVRTAVVGWWRKVRPGDTADVEQVGAELDRVRPRIVAARENGDGDTEQALVSSWRLRLQQLLDADPALGPQLQRLLDEDLAPVLPEDERAGVRQVVINAHARDHARQYIAARDVNVNEP